ncbi:protein phosphatase 2C domain-containing protein [Pendulispora albinea]|uniref:Protein phosphatase 2C domain-containing protein n=1 Tax=Pendulispora albinea TaxID=2741071 RepID=A0ABZ2M622_9BACT
MTIPWPGPDERKLPVIEFAERTHPGRDPSKQINEDACGYRETTLGHLAVVCDGMGGHEGGREASQLALKTIFEVFERRPAGPPSPGEPSRVLREAIEEANRQVYAIPTGDVSGSARPGATVVAVLHHGGGTEIAHAGDSRCYLIHGADIVQLTKDHSMVQQMVDAQLLTPEQAANHPDANRISRALGMKPEVEVELRPQPVPHVVGDVFVLCSDGLSDLVEPAEILRIAASPAAQAAGQLVDLANARGGHDNISVQVLRARESALATPQVLAPTLVQTAPPPPLGPTNTVVIPSVPAAPAVPSSTGPMAARISRPVAPTTTDEDHAEGEGGARPKRSPIVILGVLLGLAGIAVAGIAIYIALDFGSKKRHPVYIDGPDAGAPSHPAAEHAPPAIVNEPPSDAEPAPPIPSLIHPTRPRLKRDH